MTQTVSSQGTADAVLFDLDGTLLDSAADFAAVIADFCQEYGWQEPSQQALHQKVSAGARAMLTLASGIPDSAPEFGKLLEEFLDRYEQQIREPVADLYPGIPALLESLENHRIPWGIVTNKPVRFSKPILQSLGIHRTCATLICPDHVKTRKPSPEPLLLAARQLGLQPQQCIYVGDHQRDIQAGHAADMKTVAAGYGYLPLPNNDDELGIQDWNADYIVDNVAELHSLLLRLLAR
ncbi:phosphoglycolate phosphatase 2 [Pseudohongiella nitratireducens]|jgi:phosphoglycolate phosphatase|uniref:Phosphoglycolate phosphatase 2 n=1 Tax=Pseudohongiella nitratireducens TaxID=1768907 RepID=A0A917LPF3_9GAMM|nr:HAD-IA family hydrolase [Pseudohongiella nitratireducens]MDF1623753.1 HAD-IA family hydrolase [Pseudohongiella nitratireducens]GGG48818.1 phosphoglycolate phosphatase 2 [Pseudohongiella nitratireducens]|tara:strand:+ start:9017 stop:9727 length:711 start_codon:yes stop_codon:yes gene_type:complete